MSKRYCCLLANGNEMELCMYTLEHLMMDGKIVRNMYRVADMFFARPGMKRLTGHLQPSRNWPTCASNVSLSPTLFSGSGPFGLSPVPWTEKRIEREVGRAKDLSAERYVCTVLNS
jgi:hypothetical protein